LQYLGGARDEDHLAQAAWNVLALIETQFRIEQGRLPKELDDLPRPFTQSMEKVNQKHGEALSILAKKDKVCHRCVSTDDPTITIHSGEESKIVIPSDLKRPWFQWCELCGIKHVGGSAQMHFNEFAYQVNKRHSVFEPFDDTPWVDNPTDEQVLYREKLRSYVR
jgi:hypothetical protein